MRMEIDSSRIDNQVLLQDVADFTRDCYGYPRSRLFTNRQQLDKAQSHDASWIGSSYFLDAPGYYDTDRSRTPRVSWPYDETRDVSLPRLENGAGYPTCKQWWSDSGVGLRERLIEQVDPSLLTQLKGWLTGRSSSEVEDATHPARTGQSAPAIDVHVARTGVPGLWLQCSRRLDQSGAQ